MLELTASHNSQFRLLFNTFFYIPKIVPPKELSVLFHDNPGLKQNKSSSDPPQNGFFSDSLALLMV